MRPSLLAAAALLAPLAARAQFTLLTTGQYANYFNVADLADGFGPEDKAATCNGDFIFLDLDNSGGAIYKYVTASQSWLKEPLSTPPVCANGGSSLWPRDQGYVLSVTNNANTSNNDRLVALGGSPTDTNSFYSDDCGLTWTCVKRCDSGRPRLRVSLVRIAGAPRGA